MGVPGRAPEVVAVGGLPEQVTGRLGGVPGHPSPVAARVVCDNDGGLVNAVRSRFPDAELYLCEWHLRHALELLMGKIRTPRASTET